MRKYALLVEGEVHRLGLTDGPHIQPFYSIRIADRRAKLDYVAYCTLGLGGAEPLPFDMQVWREKRIKNGRLEVASGLINKPYRYLTPPKGTPNGRFLNDINFEIFYVDPFDDLLVPANNLDSLEPTTGRVEDVFLRRGDFLGSQTVLLDNVESRWKINYPQIKCEVKVVHSAASRHFPVEVVFKPWQEPSSDLYSHLRCEWAKQGELLLPSRLVASTVRHQRGKPFTIQWYMKFRWLVGDEVPNEFLEDGQIDYREPVRKHFEMDFNRYEDGILVRSAPYQVPDGLYMKAAEPTK